MGLKPTFFATHTQTTPSDTWVIPHGFGSNPSVQVQVDYAGALQSILPNSIAYPDTKTVVIGFTTPFTGTARLI